MATQSAIEWTEVTWNPTTGCDRVAAGCDNCYALALAKRLKAMGAAKYQNDGDPSTSGPGFGVTIHPRALSEPSPVVRFARGLRELDERPLPRPSSDRLHPRHLRRHPRHSSAHLSGAHQTRTSPRADRYQARLAQQPLDGGLRRVRRRDRSDRPPASHASRHEVPVVRATPHRASRSQSHRHRLGNRRRRVRTPRAADGPLLGRGHPRSVRIR